MIVPMIAPSEEPHAALGGWRAIHAVLAGSGLLLLLAMAVGLPRARAGSGDRLVSVIANNYLRVLTHPLWSRIHPDQRRPRSSAVCYVSGSSLFLINVVAGPGQFGLVFAATSLGIMQVHSLNGRPFSAWAVLPFYPLTVGPGAGGSHRIGVLLMTLSADAARSRSFHF